MSDSVSKTLQQSELSLEVKPDSAPVFAVEGRDELNLAEFPLAALSSRPAPGQLTLEFKDTIYDNQARQFIERRLTVAGTEKFGLPNAVDDEIILALIQISKKQGFTQKTVPFSRYEIIQILGWEDQTWNYQRVVQALDRWTSVTLKYVNAWWEPKSKSWVDETFHIIERLTEVKDEHGKERAAFVWSDVIFKNFQNGHLKALDLDLYRRLQVPTAKRLYRLLDKRFYRRHRVAFDLIELAINKLGIAQTYQIGNIKQRLQPAIEELENVGFIKAQPKEKRYQKHGVGAWDIIFEKALPDSPTLAADGLAQEPDQPLSEAEAELIEFGVSPRKARRLCTTHPENFIREKLDVVRYLNATKSKAPKNPVGYLVKSIEEKYSLPDGYQTVEQKAESEELVRKNKAARRDAEAQRVEREKKKAQNERQEAEAQTARVSTYLDSLAPVRRDELANEVFQRERNRGLPFSKWIDDDSQTGKLFRKQSLEEEVLRLLNGIKV